MSRRQQDWDCSDVGDDVGDDDLMGLLEQCNHYYLNGDVFNKKRLKLMEHFRSHDCHAVLAAAVDTDQFAELFTYAANFKHMDLLQCCVENGINVNIQDELESTALIYASQSGCVDIVKLLLEKNATVDNQNEEGITALMMAASNDHEKIVELLLNHNADITLKDEDGRTAVDLAANEEIEELLKNHVNTSYVLK